jgi:outer membrane protein TolC
MLPLILLLAADPLTLREALDQTAKTNPEVLAARIRIVEAEANQALAQSAYRPQLNAVIGNAYQTTNLQGIGVTFPGFGGRVGPYRTFNMRPVLTQTVLDLRVISQMRAAKDNRLAADRQAEAMREAAQLAVAELYLQALQADSRSAAAAARVTNTKAALEQATQREQAGTASKLDVARAEQQYRSERATQAALAGETIAAKARLARAIGLDTEVGDLSDPALPARDLPEARELIARGQTQRFEIRAAEARQGAARHEVDAARRGMMPTLGAVGDYGLLGAGPERSLSTYQVGATINIPIFTGGRVEAEQKAARARREVVDQELRQARLRVAEQVRTAMAEYNASRENERESAAAKAAAREAVELSRLRFESGLATNLDVVSAQAVVAASEDNEIRARYDGWIARARLAHAAGEIATFLR